MQKQEMREAVELPLSHFDLYKQIGIDPPRSVHAPCCTVELEWEEFRFFKGNYSTKESILSFGHTAQGWRDPLATTV